MAQSFFGISLDYRIFQNGELFEVRSRSREVEANMFCTRCGVQLGETDRFCPQCGQTTPLAVPSQTEQTRLTRDIRNKKIAGVCAGFARYMSVDVVLVRVIWLALAFCTGVGFIAYLVAWIIMPKELEPLPVPAGQFAPQGTPSR
jgi:phage shock protein C